MAFERASSAHGVGLGLYAEEMAYGSSLTRKLIRQQDARLRPAGYELIKPSDGSQESAVSYAYDFANRLNRIHPSDSLPASPDFTYTYLSSRPELLETLHSPVHLVTNTWDGTRPVLLEKENKLPGGSDLSVYAYTVNAIGQRTALAQSGSAFTGSPSVSWGYDGLGQQLHQDRNYINAITSRQRNSWKPLFYHVLRGQATEAFPGMCADSAPFF